jgi:hypothetical protein
MSEADQSLTRWTNLATLPSTNFKMVSGSLLTWLTGSVYLTLVVLGRDAGINGTAWDSWLIFLGAALGFNVGQYIGKRMTYASPSPDSERAGTAPREAVGCSESCSECAPIGARVGERRVMTDRLISINHREGRNGHVPDLVVIHVTEGDAHSVRSWFNNPVAEVSAHYMVCKDGAIDRFVAEDDTAWHAGRVDHPTADLVLARPGVNPNAYSIGIEHEGSGTEPLTEPQEGAHPVDLRAVEHPDGPDAYRRAPRDLQPQNVPWQDQRGRAGDGVAPRALHDGPESRLVSVDRRLAGGDEGFVGPRVGICADVGRPTSGREAGRDASLADAGAAMIALARRYWQVGVIVVLVGVLMLACHQRDNALREEGAMRVKLAELQTKTARDSVAERAANVVVTRDTVVLQRWITKRDTLRTTLRLTDTVRVAQFIAVQDSTIHACREAVGSLTTLCQRKDSLIGDLRAQLAVRVSAPPQASKAQRVLWGLGGLAVGVVAGRLAP